MTSLASSRNLDGRTCSRCQASPAQGLALTPCCMAKGLCHGCAAEKLRGGGGVCWECGQDDLSEEDLLNTDAANEEEEEEDDKESSESPPGSESAPPHVPAPADTFDRDSLRLRRRLNALDKECTALQLKARLARALGAEAREEHSRRLDAEREAGEARAEAARFKRSLEESGKKLLLEQASHRRTMEQVRYYPENFPYPNRVKFWCCVI